ncbi:hypothetical protein VTO73DRAFT_5535 [Trametes versicolor]
MIVQPTRGSYVQGGEQQPGGQETMRQGPEMRSENQRERIITVNHHNGHSHSVCSASPRTIAQSGGGAPHSPPRSRVQNGAVRSPARALPSMSRLGCALLSS